MLERLSRKTDTLRRVLFLCEDNHCESRFCEELFNSHARTDGLLWQALSRAVLPRPAARNDGPMSIDAIGALRALGAAPVNHLRLPLELSAFDVRMSSIIVVIADGGPPRLDQLADAAADRIEHWPLVDANHGAAATGFAPLGRKVAALVASVGMRPAFELESSVAAGLREQTASY